MSDPPAKKWLADDADFIATLGDLDRGMGSGSGQATDRFAPSQTRDQPAPAAPEPPVTPARRVSDDASSDRGGVSASPLLAFPRPAPDGPRRQRPLLNLFPESALVPETPQTPAPVSVVGPPAPPPLRAARPPRESRASHDKLPQLDALAYETFYGLREKPFSLSTDPKFHYSSASYAGIAQELLAAIRAQSGPALLTASVGMGKTSLCRALIQDLDRQTVTSLVGDPVLSVDDLLRTLIADFGVMAQEDLVHMQRPLLTRTLNAFLESLSLRDRRAVVFIDEAQNVPTGLLVDLAALLDHGTGTRVLQLVLVGQPALTTLLGQGDLRGIDERIARRLELGPLAAGEIAAYVRHRLTVAGGGSRIAFDAGAIDRLFARSAGVPRVVNLLCDRAMTRGHRMSAAVITAALIEAAATDLDLDAVVERPAILNMLLLWALLALLVLGGAAGALWVWRDAVNQTILRWENVPLPPGGPILRQPVPLAPIPPSEPAGNVSPPPPI